MGTVETERKQLREELDRLMERSRDLTDQLDAVKQRVVTLTFALDMLDRLQPEVSAPHRRRTQVSGGTSDFALQALRELGGAQQVDAILDKMRELGWAVDARNPIETVRTTLSRKVKDGQLRRAGFGIYELVNEEPGKADEGQAMEAGAEGRTADSDAPPPYGYRNSDQDAEHPVSAVN